MTQHHLVIGLDRYSSHRTVSASSGISPLQQRRQEHSRVDMACGVKDWTLHDLRRTAATGMADLGVLPHVIEAVLNHVSGHKAGVAGVYNKSTYANEKCAALDLWACHVKLILAQAEGANVTNLRRA
jgi:integrase